MSHIDWESLPSVKLSYTELHEYISRRNARQDDDLPHFNKVIDHLRRAVGDRDFIFFVDCSYSMGERHDEVREAFLAYIYLAKLISNNGIEIGISSQPEKILKFST
jgi:hypothetical protein